MKFAVVGASGKMGSWTAAFLAQQGHEVLLLGRRPEALREVGRRVHGARVAAVEDIAEADAVIIAVTLDAVDDVMRQLGPRVRPGQLVIDLSSLKTGPLESAGRHIPQALFLGVHPMFGSGADSLAGHNVILTPSGEAAAQIALAAKSYMEPLGAHVYTMGPAEHDDLMSIVLGLPALAVAVVARTIIRSGRLREAREMSGTSLELLMALTDSMLCQSSDLYSMLLARLPSSPQLAASFTDSAQHFATLCAGRDRAVLYDDMAGMAQRLAEASLSAGEAYDRMYAMLEALQRFPTRNRAQESA